MNTTMTDSVGVVVLVVLVALAVVGQAGPICRYPVNGYLYDITPLQAYPQVPKPGATSRGALADLQY
jgi:hypothetical protein